MRAPSTTFLTALISACLLCLTQGAAAQSLAEIATKQKEKRKGKQTKIYTEEDLKRGPARGFASGDATTGDVPSGDDEGVAVNPPQAEGGRTAAAQPPAKSDDEL